jgi:hypothetical protein
VREKKKRKEKKEEKKKAICFTLVMAEYLWKHASAYVIPHLAD